MIENGVEEARGVDVIDVRNLSSMRFIVHPISNIYTLDVITQ